MAPGSRSFAVERTERAGFGVNWPHGAPRLELADALAALAEENGGRLVIRPIYRDYAQIAEIRR